MLDAMNLTVSRSTVDPHGYALCGPLSSSRRMMLQEIPQADVIPGDDDRLCDRVHAFGRALVPQ